MKISDIITENDEKKQQAMTVPQAIMMYREIHGSNAVPSGAESLASQYAMAGVEAYDAVQTAVRDLQLKKQAQINKTISQKSRQPPQQPRDRTRQDALGRNLRHDRYYRSTPDAIKQKAANAKSKVAKQWYKGAKWADKLRF